MHVASDLPHLIGTILTLSLNCSELKVSSATSLIRFHFTLTEVLLKFKNPIKSMK